MRASRVSVPPAPVDQAATAQRLPNDEARRPVADGFEGDGMNRENEDVPRWLQRREGRKAGRYDGNKVVRWIARRNLKGRDAEADATPTTAEWPRLGGFGGLRLVANNPAA